LLYKPYYEKTFERHRKDLVDVETGMKPHLRYNEKMAMVYIKIIQTFRHYKGTKARNKELFILEEWQKKAVAIWAGWERLNADGKWVRRFGESFWELPKKNGKTILGSGLAITDTIVRGEPGGEVYAFATVKKQAEIAWVGFEQLFKKHQELKGYIDVAYSTITFSKNNTTFNMLGRDSDNVEGTNPTFALSDERHLQKDNSVRDNVQTAMIAREQPHLMHITTSGKNIESPCYQDYLHAKKVLDGVIEDDGLFAFIAEAPPKPDDESDDWYLQEEVWIAANPNYGISVTKDGMMKAAEKAKKSPSDMADFLTKHLNVWRGVGDGFISIDEWNACRVDKLDLSGRKIVGLDLSFSDDFSGKVDIYKNGKYLDIVPRAYIPKDNIADKDRELRVPIFDWVEKGLMTATEGKTIDQEYIYDDIEAELDNTDFIGYDPTYAKWIINRIEHAAGFENTVMVRQTTWGLTLATNFLRDLVREKRIRHIGDPVMDWHMSNMTITRDNQGNIKPDRSKGWQKIDLVAALINGLACIATGEPTNHEESIYEQTGIRDLD